MARSSSTITGEIAEVKLGKMLDKTKHRAGKVLPYLRNINVRWGSIETDDLLEMYFEADELDRFGLRKDDVLVCEGGEPGRAAVWDGRLPDLKFQKALHRVRFNVPYEPKLLVYFLQTLSKTRDWEDRFHGATIKHFTREMFIELPVPVPPLPEQKRIVAELDAEAAQIEAVRALVPRLRSQNPARPHPRLGHGNVTVRGELPYLIETGQVSQVTYWQQVII